MSFGTFVNHNLEKILSFNPKLSLFWHFDQDAIGSYLAIYEGR